MDDNNVQLNSNNNTERLSTPNSGATPNPGQNQRENPYSYSASETNTNAGAYNMAGTYDTSNAGTYYPSDAGMANSTYTANTTASSMNNPAEEAYAKKAKSGMIIGIISLVLNLIFCCLPFVADMAFSPGYLFIILEIAGIQNSVQGRKSEGKKGMATAGLVMNIVSLVISILLIILVLVLKFSDLLD